jgi:polyisoprenyl-teichoic acid--peptidoglycan teichoic acid transferase
METAPAPGDADPTLAVNRKPVCGQRDPMVILALGIDEVELADVIRLVRIDFVEKRILVLAIPRAFWVPIPGLRSNAITQGMLNWTYGLGEYYNGPGQGVVGISRTIYANYGVKFDRYVVLHFDNFVQVVDAVGGVDISMDEPIGNYGYYGRLHFDGEQALEYARLREFDNDHYRIKRQSEILDSLYLKMIQPDNLAKLPLLGARFLKDKSILTDLSLQDLVTFNCLASNLTSDSLVFKDIPPEFYKGAMQYGRDIIIPAPGATTFIQDMILNGEY